MIIAIILAFVMFLNLVLGIFVLYQNFEALCNRLFFILSILAAIWTFTNYMTEISDSIYWLDSTYAFGSLVMTTGLIWVLTLVESKIPQFKKIIILFVGLFLFAFSFKPGFIITSYSKVSLGAVYTGGFGWGLYLFTIIYFLFSAIMIWSLNVAQKNTESQDKKITI